MGNGLLMAFEQDQIDIGAGTETAVQLDIQNCGEYRMTYRLLAAGVPENWSRSVPDQIRVNAGGEVTVTVRIKVPPSARDAHHTIVIHAVDQLMDVEWGHAMLRVQVRANQVPPPHPFRFLKRKRP